VTHRNEKNSMPNLSGTQDFDSVSRFLAVSPTRNYRTVTGIRETRVQKDVLGRYIALRYHDTEVIRWYQDGRVVLNTGGFRTATTKARMNEYANARIFQKNFIWCYSADAHHSLAGKNYNDLDNIGVIPVPLPHAYRMQNNLFL
jgi:hypothetical protein